MSNTKISREALRRKRAISVEHFVAFDEDSAIEWKSIQDRLGLARFTADQKQVSEAKAELEDFKAGSADKGLLLTVTSVGRRRFQELVDEHPPTDEQRKKGEAQTPPEQYQWNPDTFWPAILAETVNLDLTPEEWTADVLESDEWNGGEVEELRDLVLNVCTTSKVTDLGN